MLRKFLVQHQQILKLLGGFLYTNNIGSHFWKHFSYFFDSFRVIVSTMPDVIAEHGDRFDTLDLKIGFVVGEDFPVFIVMAKVDGEWVFKTVDVGVGDDLEVKFLEVELDGGCSDKRKFTFSLKFFFSIFFF